MIEPDIEDPADVDRYGKMFFPDVPVLWDTATYERLLAEPIVAASQRADDHPTRI